jgi:hypothetical protein
VFLATLNCMKLNLRLLLCAALVYSLPNYGDARPLNQFDIEDNIAFVDRGKVISQLISS